MLSTFLTSWLAKNHSTIVIEDLNVSGMLRNHRLANAIADAGLYECRRQLEYKTQLYGSQLIVADRWFPSSQICSNCGFRQKMPLKERTYHCQKCGIQIDRDLNASINLESLAVSSTVNACGESHTLFSLGYWDSTKQEQNRLSVGFPDNHRFLRADCGKIN